MAQMNTYIVNRLTVAKVGGGRRMNWEFKVSRYKLLHLEWINTRAYCVAQGTISSLLG